MKIVVLAGGLSPERDVSLSSGVMATNALIERGHQAILVDLFMGVETLPEPVSAAFENIKPVEAYAVPKTEPDINAIRASRKGGYSAEIGNGVVELCRAADIVYIALHGGCGENGSLQAFLDLSDIRYTGSASIGCALAMDKHVTKRLLLDAGVPSPAGRLYRRGDVIEYDSVPIPCVVKPVTGGSSIGISIVRDRAELGKALETAFDCEDRILIEEYIKGRELSAGVLNGEPLPLIEIIPKSGFYDYRNKYQPGQTEEIVPGRFDKATTERVQALAVKAADALGLSVYTRIDFLIAENGEPYCLEANTLPGMTPTSLFPQEAAAVGIDYPSLCDKIVRLSMDKYTKE